MPLRLPPPLEAIRTVAINVPSGGDLDDAFWHRLPTEAGVILLEDENARPVLIRGIGDPRAFARRRLLPEESDAPARTDYRAVVRRISVISTGHTLLAELLGAWCEAALDEELARLTSARLTMCVVLCDPTARLPVFRPVEWTELWLGSVKPTAHEQVIGPFMSVKRARRWTEQAIDLFDLCRYDHLLAQTPNATACVYKQMGKCPAPCDGSEPVESYRERFARAAGFLGLVVQREQERCEKAMKAAAEDLDFEDAAALKERLGAIDSMKSGGPWEVCDLKACEWRISGPTRKTPWVRRSALDLTGLYLLADRNEQDENPPDSRGNRTPLLSGRTLWLLLATLTECLQKGLAKGEVFTPVVREQPEAP